MQLISRLAGPFFVFAGAMHFIVPRFYRAIMPYLLQTDLPKDVILRVSEFINANEHYHLSITMGASKAALDAAHGIPHSTIVTALARNGRDFGIRVSGMAGNTWFTGPAQMVKGLYFPGAAVATSLAFAVGVLALAAYEFRTMDY